MAKDERTKTAREQLAQFFDDLGGLAGMDQETVHILQDLWNKDKLGRDELLAELENVRSREGKDGKDEA